MASSTEQKSLDGVTGAGIVPKVSLPGTAKLLRQKLRGGLCVQSER